MSMLVNVGYISAITRNDTVFFIELHSVFNVLIVNIGSSHTTLYGCIIFTCISFATSPSYENSNSTCIEYILP